MPHSISPQAQRSSLAIRSTLERLRVQVRVSKTEPIPGNHPGPILWLSLIEGLIDTAERYLDNSLNQEFGDDPLKIIQDAAVIIRGAYDELDEMAGYGLQDLPYPIVAPLQRWFDSVRIKNTVIFRAKLLDKYEIGPFQLRRFAGIRNPAKSLAAAIANVNWDILRVTIPSKAFSYLPHMAIVAHEIGHALYPRIKWNLSALEAGRLEMQSAIQRRISRFDQEASKSLIKISNKWHEEIAADAFSFYLAGPASFFALSDSLMYMGGMTGMSETHPPNSLRRKILHDHLTEGGDRSFATMFERHTGYELVEDFNSPLIQLTPSSDAIFEFYQRKRREQDTRIAAIFAELPARIVAAVPAIYEDVIRYLKRTAPDEIYTPAQLNDDLEHHLLPLLDAVPPIETGEDLSAIAEIANSTTENGRKAEQKLDFGLNNSRPVGFASILNIGWAALLTKHSQLKVKTSESANVDCQKLEKIHGLLLKAVELSEALRSWRTSGESDGHSIGD